MFYIYLIFCIHLIFSAEGLNLLVYCNQEVGSTAVGGGIGGKSLIQRSAVSLPFKHNRSWLWLYTIICKYSKQSKMYHTKGLQVHDMSPLFTAVCTEVHFVVSFDSF
jgi:hypothetical protein